MKYKKLTIHNIASFEDAEIDFENGPLAQSAVFLIAGPTGVGKSTILDAVCLALYNMTPRLNNAPTTAYEDEFISSGNTVGAKDPRQMVRRGAKEASVMFYFEGNDGREYLATWEVKSKTKGKQKDSLNDVKRSLEMLPNGIVWDKKPDIIEKIQEAVGLKFDQFCRTSMLAQGEFSRFLIAGEGEKADILEKLTDTGQFLRIGEKISENAKQAKTDYEEAAKQIENIKILPDEEVEKKKTEMAALSQKAAELKKQESDINAKIEWLKQCDEIRKEEEENKAELEKAERLQTDEKTVALQKKLADWERTDKERTTFQSKKEVVKKLQELQKELATLKNELPGLTRLVGEFMGGVNAKKADFNEKNESIKKQEDHKETYQQSQTLIGKMKNVLAHKTDAENAEKERQNATNALSDIQKSIKEKEQAHKETSKKIKALTDDIKKKKKELAAKNREKIEEERAQLNATLRECDKAQSAVKTYREKTNGNAKKHADLTALQAEIRQMEQAIPDKQKHLQQLADDEKRLREQYEKLKKSVGDAAQELRHKLAVGDVCPICGQTVHDVLDDEFFKTLVEPAEKEWEEKSLLLSTENKNMAEETARLKEKKQREEKEKKSLAEEDDNLQSEKSTCADLLNSLHIALDDKDLDKVLKTIEEKTAEYTRQLAKVEEEFKAANHLQDDVNKLQEKANKLSAEEKNQYELLQKERASEAKTTTQKEAAEKQINDLKKKIDDESAELTAMFKNDKWQADINRTIKVLGEKAEAYNNVCDEVRKLDNEIQQDEKMLRQMESPMQALGAQPKAVACAQPRPAEEIIDKINDYKGRKGNTETLLKNHEEQIKEKEKQLASFFQKNPEITEEYLSQLAAWASATATREKLEAQKSNLDKLKGQQGKIAERKNTLIANRPDTLTDADTAEQLRTVKAQLSEQEGLCNQSIGAIDQELKANDERKTEVEELKLQHKNKITLYTNWKQLDDIFGGQNNANKFKRIAQSYVLQQLLLNANQYLETLTQRYELRCQLGSYAILVSDKYNGGRERSATTLSGGESFIISLALALGLSNIAGANLTSDIIFIDEGFGTLSTDALETVMNTLTLLSQCNGKKVGIISHVEQLKQRIDTQIAVSCKAAGLPSTLHIY